MKRYCYNFIPFDLHVLNTPPAFVLSQNQTLRKKRMWRSCDRRQIDRRVLHSEELPPDAARPLARSTQFSLFLFTRSILARHLLNEK
jgi:hypothetical protein